MFLDRFQGECSGLLFALPFLAWKQHPFTNDCASGGVFGSHDRFFLVVSVAEKHARLTSGSSMAEVDS